MKRFLAITIVIWIILLIVTFFTGSDDLTFEVRFFGTLVVAAISAGGIITGKIRDTRNSQSTGLISCKKCGYFGAGSGFCTRCGSNWVEEIKK